MSDLDAAGVRSFPDSISRIATGKLRSLQGAGGLRFGQTEGLYDVFAEIFAQVAAAAPRLEPVTATPETQKNLDSESETDFDEIGADDVPWTVKEDQSPISNDGNASDDQSDPGTSGFETIADSSGKDDSAAPLAEAPRREPTVEADVSAEKELRSDWTETDVESLPEIARKVRASSDTDRHQRHRNGRDTAQQRESQGPELLPGQETRPRTASTDKLAGTVPEDSKAKPTQYEVPVPLGDATDGERRTNRRKTSESSKQDSVNSARPRQSVGAQRQSVDAVNAAQLDTLGKATESTGSHAPRAAVRGTSSVVASVQNTQSTSASASLSSNRGDARNSVLSLSSGNNSRGETKSARAQPTAGTDTSETISRVKLIQRVSRAFQHLGTHGGNVRLRLAPAELGSVRVEMKIENHKVDARVVAETEAAGALLREHLPDLRARLESFGMQVERIEVETEGSDSRSDLPNEREPQHRDDARREHREHRDQQPEPRLKSIDGASRTDRRGSYLIGNACGGVDLRL